MRTIVLILVLLASGCRGRTTFDVGPEVAWMAIATVNGEAITSISPLFPATEPFLPPDHPVLLLGFSAEQIPDQVRSTFRTAAPCETTIDPVWLARMSAGDLKTTDRLPEPITADWIPARCPAGACRNGSCQEVVTEVVARGHHTCALTSFGSVHCWGLNSSRQCGRASDRLVLTPHYVPGIEDATVVAVSTEHTCVIHRDGSISCWGNNQRGQLGDGTRERSAHPRRVPIAGAIALALGDRHSCALLSDGRVACWGSNDYGQLGDGRTETVEPVFASIVDVVQIASGDQHTCALNSAGEVYCWGQGDFGQLGIFPPVDRRRPERVIANIVELKSGSHHTCARDDNGEVFCWGSNADRQVGGEIEAQLNIPLPRGLLEPATELILGHAVSCARHEDGSASCWGSNHSMEISIVLDVPEVSTPRSCPHLEGALSGAFGNGYGCAVSPTQSVLCWGWNGEGELGINRYPHAEEPIRVPGRDLERWSLGAHHVCRVDEDHKTICWGRNRDHEVGIGAVSRFESPTVAHVDDVRLVSTKEATTCALKEDGTVSCWGNSEHLGGGEELTPVAGIDDATALTVGANHGCVIRPPGEVWCFGEVIDQKLGAVYDEEDDGHARLVPGLRQVEAISAGVDFTCARTSTAVYCWGDNECGQMGRGDQTDSSSVSQVLVGDIAEVSAGMCLGCAREASGTILCWGLENYTGIGSTSDSRTTPVLVNDITDATKVSVGRWHACARRVDGSVYCWGFGHRGRLGNGAIDNQFSPVRVNNLSDVRQIASGKYHSCAETEANEVYCWGWGAFGVFANEDTGFVPDPVEVIGLP